MYMHIYIYIYVYEYVIMVHDAASRDTPWLNTL